MRDVTRGYGGRVEERRSASYENERMVGRQQEAKDKHSTEYGYKQGYRSISLSLSLYGRMDCNTARPTYNSS